MAIGPIDYTGLQPQQNFLQDISQGLQVGGAIQQIQQQQNAQALAQRQAEQYQTDVAAALANPTPQNFAGLAIKYPQQREAFKQSWDTLDAGERKAQGDAAAQAYSALLGGRPDIAKQVVQSRIDALTNSGGDTSAEQNILRILDSNPQQAQAALGFTLSHIQDPKAFASQFGALGQENRAAAAEPGKQALVQEEILTAQQKRTLDDFDAKIKAANSETERGRLTLEREKFVADQGIKQATQGQELQGQLGGIDNALDTVRELGKSELVAGAKDFGLNTGVGSVLGNLLAKVPGTANKDFRAQVDTLKAQLFLPAASQLKGLGALSNAEGEKLGAAIATLSADLSPKAFKNALGTVQRYLEKGRQAVLANQKLPQTGGGFVATIPGIGRVNEGDVNRLLRQNPGATREQVMQFLQSQQGAK